MAGPSIAVILPCLNEAAAIGAVVASFRKALPGATVYVYDNASTDDTAATASCPAASSKAFRRGREGLKLKSKCRRMRR